MKALPRVLLSWSERLQMYSLSFLKKLIVQKMRLMLPV